MILRTASPAEVSLGLMWWSSTKPTFTTAVPVMIPPMLFSTP